MQERIYLSSPTIHEEEKQFVQQAFETNWVAPLGPHVNAFEKEIAEYADSGHAAAMSSGTAAIHLAMKLAGVKAGDTIFVPSLTFVASCSPALYEGAVPVFIDSERDTWNMSPEALRRAFDKYPNTRVVVMVHLYGTPSKNDEIVEICRERNAILIEDAAESLGALYKGQMAGTFGEYGVYSFNGNKIITTSGGGMLVSRSEEDIVKARFWATQSREPELHYEHKEIGYNYRMSNITAGIGRGQLLHLNQHIALKKRIYHTYKDAFTDTADITMNPYLEDTVPNHWLSCITLKKESKVKPIDIIEALERENIESRPIWKPMHLQPLFKGNDFVTIEDEQSVAEDIFNRGVCLPSDIKMTDVDIQRVASIIKGLF